MMGLKIPDLDRQSYDLLMRDALAKLPSFSDGWNDFNTSDPGITILELLAWFADIDSYRFNRINDAHRRAFLKLVGLKPQPNRPASVLLRFKSTGSGDNVSAGTKLLGNGFTFRTVEDLRVSGAEIASIVTSGFGEDITVIRMPFYPFGTFLQKDSGFTMNLKEEISGTVRIYFKVRSMGLEPNGSDTVSWRYCNSTVSCNKPPSKWNEATVVKDDTCGLRKSGFIEFSLPSESARVAAVLQNEKGYENLPLIEAIVPDSVFAEQIEEVSKKPLGLSSGYVNQIFAIEDHFDPDSLKVKVGAKVWNPVENLEASGPDDEVYTLRGFNIVFGDGGYGKIPPKDKKIVCSYEKNEGSRGNIGKEVSWQIVDDTQKFKAENPFAAEGGEDAKSMEELFSSFDERLRQNKRAVTAKDHEELALKTQGTVLARAVADVDRNRNRIILTLIPESEKKSPMPSDATLDKVNDFLEDKLLLTTRLELKKPLYAEVHVAVVVRSLSFDKEGAEKAIVERLERFLHPLYGGKEAKGWVDTNTLYISQLYLQLASIDSVASVERMMVTVRYPDGRIVRKKDGKIEAPEGVIFSSGEHSVSLIVPGSPVCGGSA